MNCALCRRAEQVAVGVGDEAANRTRAVGASGERAKVVEGGRGAGVAGGGLDYLEHRAVETVPRGRTEQIALGVGDEAGPWVAAISAIGERPKADKNGRGAGVAAG